MARPSQVPFDRVRTWCGAHGLNLVGVVDSDAFDAGQPAGRRARDHVDGSGTIVVLGSGGPACWKYLEQRKPAELARGPAPDHHPIDAWSCEVGGAFVEWLGAAGQGAAVVLPNDAATFNFVQLAEMAGLGSVSPVIHQLLHPEFGPWVSLRVAVVLRGRAVEVPAPEVDETFRPCDGCEMPCLLGCPVDAYSSRAPFDACSDHRLGGGCADGCGVRRGCRIGQQHRYGPTEETFRHRYSHFVMERVARARLPLWKRLLGRRPG